MKKTVIYIYPWISSFIKKDIDFLSKDNIVKSPQHSWIDKKLIPIRFVQQFFFLINNLHSCQAIFVMFGGYWSFLPSLLGKLWGKPVFIIPGGTDCVSFPAFNYGSLRKPLLALFIKWSYQLSLRLIPVDESLAFSEYEYHEDCINYSQGFKYHFPQLKTPYTVVHNGFDPDFFGLSDKAKIHNSFIVVAAVNDMIRFKLKGIDIVFELAFEYSNCSFTIVGIQKSVTDQLGEVPENVQILPFLSQDQFIEYLYVSEFVLQLSVSEGFPNSLCEAMLCRCIPIGSSVGAIPLIIGDTGFVMKSSNMGYIKERFNEILELTPTKRAELGKNARKRIAEYFHISKREDSFRELMRNPFK
jgi:glycosyltransferase involved in cell wall biosynthesis